MRNIIIIAVLAGTLCACSSKDQVSYNSDGVRHTSSLGKKTDTSNFPLPVYPNANPSGSLSSEQGGADTSQFMILSSPDSVDKVALFYRTELKEKGWQLDRIDTIGQMVTFATHKDNMEGSISITGDKNNTSITLSAGSVPGNIQPAKDDPNFTPDKNVPATD